MSDQTGFTFGDLARLAMKLPVPAKLLLPAQAIHACQYLGMTDTDTRAALTGLDVDAIIRACEANVAIQEFRKSTENVEGWSSRSVQISPTVRMEFDTAIIFGQVPGCATLALNKDWGKVIRGIHPIRETDHLDYCRIVYHLKPDNKMRQRWEWRDSLRYLLRPRGRLVRDAMHFGKGEFLKRLASEDRIIIWQRLELEPGKFWVRCRRGDKFGIEGFEKFHRHLEEKTVGMYFDFGEEAIEING